MGRSPSSRRLGPTARHLSLSLPTGVTWPSGIRQPKGKKRTTCSCWPRTDRRRYRSRSIRPMTKCPCGHRMAVASFLRATGRGNEVCGPSAGRTGGSKASPSWCSRTSGRWFRWVSPVREHRTSGSSEAKARCMWRSWTSQAPDRLVTRRDLPSCTSAPTCGRRGRPTASESRISPVAALPRSHYTWS